MDFDGKKRHHLKLRRQSKLTGSAKKSKHVHRAWQKLALTPECECDRIQNKHRHLTSRHSWTRVRRTRWPRGGGLRLEHATCYEHRSRNCEFNIKRQIKELEEFGCVMRTYRGDMRVLEVQREADVEISLSLHLNV